MKHLNVLTLLIFAYASWVYGDTTDPVADYKQSFNLTSINTLYKWSVDMDGDGKNEVFLTSKEDWHDEIKQGSIPTWYVYLAKHDGSGYILSCEEDEGGLSVAPGSTFDTNKLYVGQITQLGKRGIITMQVYTPKGQSTVAKIFAYTVEGDHLKRTLLTTFDPDSQKNAIFNQYLTDAKRTKVQLQEVTP